MTFLSGNWYRYVQHLASSNDNIFLSEYDHSDKKDFESHMNPAKTWQHWYKRQLTPAPVGDPTGWLWTFHMAKTIWRELLLEMAELSLLPVSIALNSAPPGARSTRDNRLIKSCLPQSVATSELHKLYPSQDRIHKYLQL